MKSRVLVAATWGLITHRVGQFPSNDLDENSNAVSLHYAANTANRLIETYKDTVGAPGISVCVSVGGTTIYNRGFGFADVEQGVKITPQTKFRIASISKSFTSLLVGRMLDQGRLDLDADITTYLPDFSPKTKEGKSAPISMRHLLSHTSGIRHYSKSKEEEEDEYSEEMFSTKAYDSAQDSLDIFRDDSLLHLPGEDYSYSTHGFTVVAAVLEAIMSKNQPLCPLFERPDRLKAPAMGDNKKLPDEAKSSSMFKQLFAFLGLQNTCLDEPYKIVPFRARPYRRVKTNGGLENTPWVDNSCKWSGGGLLSTAPDLVQMANHLIDIYMGRFQAMEELAVVSRDTLVNCLWRPNRGTIQGHWLPGSLYGLGWFVARRSTTPADKTNLPTHLDRLYVGHTGGAVGFTSILFMSLPIVMTSNREDAAATCSVSHLPSICVAILVNLERAMGIGELAIRLTEAFTAALLAPQVGSWASMAINEAPVPVASPAAAA
ncbi:beta LACTamase domain containing family member [Echinococcus multilocularis]|uniref:Beta LACTamase domain containing family member n=1 Tax=Echinococcus multilocularis TaxID=6211 RepID=A0A068YH88_ECHMU|nr:beta LACTamase domain containing family member [Echinococcus multilocularis]